MFTQQTQQNARDLRFCGETAEGSGMKPTKCIVCRKLLSPDEVALNQRLLGAHIGAFRCTDCLAQKMGATPSMLRELIAQFKERNCVYFTRLMEDTPDEQANDDLSAQNQ